MGLVVGVLALSFAIWGIGDIFKGFGRSSLASVGSTEISVEQFRQIYNEQRPHRALDRRTPAQAYTALPKARPTGTPAAGYYRVRFDHVGTNGKISLRRAGKMHHLGIGTAHAGKAVVILVTEAQVTVIDRTTRQTLATNTIDPTRSYWRNNEREPGRWPGSQI